MIPPFQTLDLIEERASVLVYRAQWEDGTPFLLTQVQVDADGLRRLQSPGVFALALEKLQEPDSPHLRQVVAGGIDESAGGFWITSRWVAGTALAAVEVGEGEIRALRDQVGQILEKLDQWGNALDLGPEAILTTRLDSGEMRCLFQIDYQQWFHDWAMGRMPGAERSAAEQARQLIAGYTAKQLHLPKKPRPIHPIPFVEERSPALATYDAPPDPWLGRALAWLGLLAALGVIVWFTIEGTRRTGELPREERPAWNPR